MKPIMWKYVALILLLCFSKQSFAQTEEHAVKVVIQQLFKGMRQSDTVLMKAVLYPTCFLKSVFKTKNGEVKLDEQSDGVSRWLKSIAKKHEGIYDERLLSYETKIDAAMAVVWAPYEFYISDNFSHCGVDVFTLIKTIDGWKIVGIVDTRRKEGCGK